MSGFTKYSYYLWPVNFKPFMNLYVANIPFKANDSQLKELFQAYGEVKSAKIITDKFTQRSRGFGFVEMNNDDEARAAMAALNGGDFMGKTLVVNEARPRTDRPTGGGGGGRGNGGGGFRKSYGDNY
jgi:RNA recognition motif-containing protein